LKTYHPKRQRPDPELAEGSFIDKSHMATGPFGRRRDLIFRPLLVKGNTQEDFMRSYEITYPSVNTESHIKNITAFVIEPDRLNAHTGAMLITHGWGGNRLDYRETMAYACEEFNLICLSVEFRQSGFDFDPVKGLGAYVPYDASFYQVFDVLNGLRTILDLRPGVNRRRLFLYGGSQGGHITLLSTIYAPQTFAFAYATSPVTYIESHIQKWAGREFAAYEFSIRNVMDHAEFIDCPLRLEHGTIDDIVPDHHTRLLAAKLESLKKSFTVEYIEGGGHSLAPVTSRLETFKRIAPEPLKTLTREGDDDFLRGSIVEIPCQDRVLRIDWSKPTDSIELFCWK
jgi:predicted esterase